MNPIIDKIKKLLRLSKDGAATAEEAAAALAKAMQLAAQAGVSLADIPADSDSGILGHQTIDSQAGPAHLLASGLVKKHFGVDTLFDSRGGKKRIHFIGLPEQIDLASYVYTYLVRTMRSAWRKRANRRLRDREAFLKGFACAINRLMPAAFHRPGLILSAEKYVQDVLIGTDPNVKLSSLKGPEAKSDKSFHHGFEAGDKAGIRNAIRGTSQPLLPL
jgi:hypothetical protein